MMLGYPLVFGALIVPLSKALVLPLALRKIHLDRVHFLEWSRQPFTGSPSWPNFVDLENVER